MVLVDTRVESDKGSSKITPMTLGEVNTRITELAELHEHDTQDLYALLEDAQDSRTRISQRVTMDSQGVDLLMEDRIAHQETILIVEEEAYASREAWANSVGLSQAVHYELQTLREQVHETRSQMQQTEMAELRETDRRHEDRIPYLTTPTQTTITPESVQAMIDQALLRNSTNGDESHRNEGIVGLTRWIEKMEPVFHISGCAVENQVKGNDVPTYTEHFQELTLICTKFVSNEAKKVDKYINGLPNNIYGNTDNKRKADIHPETPCHRKKWGAITTLQETECRQEVLATLMLLMLRKDNKAVPKGNGCFECGAPGHFKRDCPKLKNKDGGNRNAQGWYTQLEMKRRMGMH
ncbi:putative reverse transcriptase domain-containing protein [Tanacetum coccineum]